MREQSRCSRRQIVLNLLSSVLFFQSVYACNFSWPPDLAIILLLQGFPRRTYSLVPSMCFCACGCLRFNSVNCCRLDTRIPSNNDRRKWGPQSQLSHSPLTQQAQIIQCYYQRKSTAPMEHYVVFHQLTYEWVHRYNQFGNWLTSFSYPQRMFTLSLITSFTKSCAQATLIENCFSNLVNKYSTVARNIRQPTAI